MKKCLLGIIIGLLVIFALILVWWNVPKSFIKDENSTSISSISVFNGNSGNDFKIADKDSIQYVVNSIQGVSFKKSGISQFRMGYGYKLTFYDNNKNEIDIFIINSDNKIRKDPLFYSTADNMKLVDFLNDMENSILKEKGIE